MTSASTIGICIEVAGPEQLAAWLEAGWMPNLRGLRDTGAMLPLRSVADLSSGSIWPSFVTGAEPARHGQFFTHMQLDGGSYRIVKRYADDITLPPFWAPLARDSRPVGLVDIAQTRPLPGFPGVHVAGWGGEYPAWPPSSQPPELFAQILQRIGPHPLADSLRIAAAPVSLAEHTAIADDLVLGARRKAALSRWLFQEREFALFLTVFAETHWWMHLLWHLHDPTHPRHDPALAARHAHVLPTILGEIDGMIGELRAARPDADLLVFSLSGMGPNHSGWHVLPQLLARLGLAGDTATPKPATQGPGMARRIEGVVGRDRLQRLKERVPARLWDSLARRVLFARAGWERTQAFCLANDASGAIRLNLEGREPKGRVARADYDATLDLIEAALRELVDATTGRPVVADVLRPHAADARDGLPDLAVVWAGEAPVRAVRSARVGEIRAESPERRTGGHRSTGALIAHGPRIAAVGEVEGGHILDLPPTFQVLAGIDPTPGLDGAPLRRILR